MRRAKSAAIAITVLAAGPALAGNSYILPDGVSRASGVTIHCATSVGTAVPCGTAAQPLVVTPPVGAATAANQGVEISTQQAMAQAVGTQSDPVYGSGPASLVSLLKGLNVLLGTGIQSLPVGGQPVSRTISITGPEVAANNVTLFLANPGRQYLAFQAPQTNAIWVNFLGGTAGPNLPDCVYLAPGTLYESGQYVNRGAITVYSPVAATIAAWEG